MKDQNGLYYYPDPADTSTRVYVKQGPAGPQFRLGRQDLPEVWDRHGWLDMSVIEAAAQMYQGMGAKTDPRLLYDANVAEALLKSANK